MREKEYLGDGLYVNHDGLMYTLSTDRGRRDADFVCLEPHVLNAFLAYVERVEGVKITIQKRGARS